MKKICICGHFGGNNECYDGQTVKTKNIYKALGNVYGLEQITCLDTYGWKKHPFSFFIKCIKAIKDHDNIIVLPAHKGVRVFIPLFVLLNNIYHRNIMYVVIGGWLTEMVKQRKSLIIYLNKLKRIFVETEKMKRDLNDINLKNIEVLVNFKNLEILKEAELIDKSTKPYKLCVFSRVIPEKGIEEAINVVKEINHEKKEKLFILDIYGPVGNGYKERFESCLKDAPATISYKGCINADESVSVLKNYHLMLFPTKFKTEGIPGTVIDALASGLPTITSRWDNVNQIINDNENGYIYEFDNYNDLKNKLIKAVEDNKIQEMSVKCLKDAGKYQMENAIIPLVNEINDVDKKDR